MKISRKEIIPLLVILYIVGGFVFVIGTFFWNVLRMNVESDLWSHLPEVMVSAVFFTLFWPFLLLAHTVSPGLALFMIVILCCALVFLYKKKYLIGLSLIFSILLLLGSLFLPVTVTQQSDMTNIRLGLPLKFLVQDQSSYDYPDFPFPRQLSIASAGDSPTYTLWPKLFLSFALTFSATSAFLAALKSFRRKSHHIDARRTK